MGHIRSRRHQWLRPCRYRRPDLVVVDPEPSDGSCSEALGRIRVANRLEAYIDPDVPVIALRSDAEDPWGTQDPNPVADDYLVRPFAYEDLRVRIDAILRRRHSRFAEPVQVGERLVDSARRKVVVGDRAVGLARREFTLLRVLASDPTKVFAKDELLREV